MEATSLANVDDRLIIESDKHRNLSFAKVLEVGMQDGDRVYFVKYEGFSFESIMNPES